MKTSEVDIVIVPGWSSSGPDHWQSRWERQLPTARRVEQADWYQANRDLWTATLIETLEKGDRPVVVVAHSLGVATVAHAAPRLASRNVIGAFLVAPADVESAHAWPETDGHVFDPDASGFAPLPHTPLPFPATLVASTDDPYCAIGRAETLARAWEANLVNAGALGHINVASGHGPWPDGLLLFGRFLKHLGGETL